MSFLKIITLFTRPIREVLTHGIKTSGGLRKAGLLAGLILCFSGMASAKNLRVIGPTYPIIETDLLEWIEARLSHMQTSGEFITAQHQLQQRANQYVNRPTPVSDITRATHNRTFYFDPTIILPDDITDHERHVIQKAGARINPLTTVSLRQPLLFFDGDDTDQVAWAKKIDHIFKGNEKLILVKGSVVEQRRHWKHTMYFDQAGALVKKLGIQQLPAIVEQHHLLLRIKEFKV